MDLAPDTHALFSALDEAAKASGFSGAIRVDVAGEHVVAAGYGMADRRHQTPVTPETQFAMASGSKAFTALAIQSLIEDGVLSLETTARSILGADLPLIDDRVSVKQLLGHTSGIGDYLDEETLGDIAEHVMTSPVHRLAETEGFLAEMDGYPQVSEPGARFAYNNGGYVVLALLAERASGIPFHDLVQQRVIEPAGLSATGFLRSDDLPAGAATGYLHETGSDRTNVLHLPVRGNGDGGAYTTVADLSHFWRALLGGQIVSPDSVAALTRPRVQDEGMQYARGFWSNPQTSVIMVDGCDAGVSMRARFDPESALAVSILSNTSEGAWPVTARMREELG